MAWFQRDLKVPIDAVSETIDSQTSVVQDEIASLNDRQDRAANLLGLFNEFLKYRVTQIPDIFPPEDAAYPLDRPNTLLRMLNKDSHTKHSSSLGFQCSEWRSAPPAASFAKLKMHKDEMRQSLMSHLDGRTEPSRWISVTDDMGWVLRYGPQWQSNYTGSKCQVAIINVPKLNRLGILWERSVDLTRSVGLEEVKYAWREHFLVYGWIPAQCLICVVPFAQFRIMCEKRGITTGRKVYDPSILLEPLHAKEQCDEEFCNPG
ncbi:hypothetical protein, variant [Exophiala sideris]|uniref:DUF7587 domain-containing protein n=1 Tax=Exophiala sideris TaxID=1016849 RepID=A0A0D1YPH1_9EURO|nr:hypothetical protein PV11_05196 [Exophiala sideris]KIV83145.1 hypothetical protein, variant [Exophiala sideris]